MPKIHTYTTTVTWTGDLGTGTSGYRTYDRTNEIAAGGRPIIPGTADPAFRGDPARWNPEQLLVASLSQCHMLWYLHLCSDAGVIVTGYTDQASGDMEESAAGGRFTEVVLRPQVTVMSSDMTEAAEKLHAEANRVCFIANSVNFPVRHEAIVRVADSENRS